MPDITNPQAVAFSNEEIRPAANDLAQLYFRAKRVYAQWFGSGVNTLITNTSDPIVDGSMTDGRPPIEGTDANNIITRLGELITDMEASGSAKLNTILAVAPQPGGEQPD